MFENPRRDRQARNFATNVPKMLDLKSSSEQIFSENCRWVPLLFVYEIVFPSLTSFKIHDQALRRARSLFLSGGPSSEGIIYKKKA